MTGGERTTTETVDGAVYRTAPHIMHGLSQPAWTTTKSAPAELLAGPGLGLLRDGDGQWKGGRERQV